MRVNERPRKGMRKKRSQTNHTITGIGGQAEQDEQN